MVKLLRVSRLPLPPSDVKINLQLQSDHLWKCEKLKGDDTWQEAQTRFLLEVTEAILGGYGGDDFQEFFEETSGALDSMAEDFEAHFPEMTKKFNPWTHRLMGHGWSLDEEVPERVLNRLEKEYGVSPSKAICYCREYQEKIIGKSIELTGLAHDPATAFAALVIDLHQLQDLEPGNRSLVGTGPA